MDDGMSSSMDRATVNGLVQLARDLAGTSDLTAMLSLLVTAITEVAGFECAAINLLTEEGDLQVAAVAGSSSLEQELLGSIGSRAAWDVELAKGDRHGGVQMVFDAVADSDLPTWSSEDESWFARRSGHLRAWRPEFALYVPMVDEHGDLVGVVSADLPRSGLVPDRAQLAALEVVARQAEMAVVGAQAHALSSADERLYGSVFETAESPTCIADGAGRLIRVNGSFRSQFGEVSAASEFDDLTNRVEGAEGLASVLQDRATGLSQERTLVVSTGLGHHLRWFRVVVRGVAGGSADPARAVCTMTDITADRRMHEQYQHDAEHDVLTGLLNRRGLHEAAAAVLAPTEIVGVVAVLFCDLDDFKLANDLHGHQHGDDVLIEVARCLRTAVPEPSLLSRVGGDEFVIVARCGSAAEAQILADAVVSCVSVRLPGSDERVTASVGMAIDQGGRGVDDLLHAADEALYRAKQSGKRGWVQA